MLIGKKKKIYLAAAVGVLALFLTGISQAGNGNFFAELVRVNGDSLTAITVTAVNEIDRTTVVDSIDVNNGTIRMIAIVPGDSGLTPVSHIVWTVASGTGTASIDRCGQLFAITNGTVIVTATYANDSSIMNTEIITITNQVDPIYLGRSAEYTILAESGISKQVGTTIAGDIGVSPASATTLTGFSQTLDPSGVYATSDFVTGSLYAADYSDPTPANLGVAVGDMLTAYNTGNGLAPTAGTELYGGDLSGKTLSGGIYKWSTGVSFNGSLTLSGDASDVWVFQIAQGITEAAGTTITLTGGARSENVFWLSATTISLGTGSNFKGIALCATNITLGASCEVNGRLLAQTAVTLEANCVIGHPSYIS